MIGYYIHHHGYGHLARASAVAAAMTEPVVALSSLAPSSLSPSPPADQATSHPFAEWIALAPDPAVPHPADRRAGGALHWAPLNSRGYQTRMRQISAWAAAACPRLVVVDVSVEITALLRLLGVPVAVVASPGERDDEAHRLAHRLAARIIAPWPREVMEPAYLRPFADKTFYVGAFSRFDRCERTTSPGRDRVLVLVGAGGGQVSRAALSALQDEDQEWTWRGIGGPGLPWAGDVWDELQAADIVISHAGLGALAEIAAAGRPAVVIPQPRPFGEQDATARALGAAGLAITLDAWPGTGDWKPILTAARDHDAGLWNGWNDGSGAQRFAQSLTGLGVM